MAKARPIRLPARDFSERPLPVVELALLSALRVHSLKRPAINFRLNPAHRFSHPDAPAGLLYLGESCETCLWECFGDSILDPDSVIPAQQWINQRVSEVTFKKPLRLCDLTQTAVRSALKVDLSALKHTDLTVPQEWGLAIQNHPKEVDGLLYSSRFTGKRCLVLFERKKTVSLLKSKVRGKLMDLDEGERFLGDNQITLI